MYCEVSEVVSIAYHMLCTCHRHHPPIELLFDLCGLVGRCIPFPIHGAFVGGDQVTSQGAKLTLNGHLKSDHTQVCFVGRGVLWWFTWMIPSKMCCERMLFTQIERKKTTWPDSMWLTQQIFFACFWWGGGLYATVQDFFTASVAFKREVSWAFRTSN